MQTAAFENPFRLGGPAGESRTRSLLNALLYPASKALGLTELAAIYDRHVRRPMSPVEFAELALEALEVEPVVDESQLNEMPAEGPVVVIANHPFGGLEGIVLAALLGRRREDVRIMANYLLGRIGELRPLLIQVDPFGNAFSPLRNIGPMREALRHLANGGMLGVFPSGEVAHREWTRWEVTEPAWAESIGRIIRRTGATVVPVFFGGGNSALFQLAGLLHRRLRTALLPAELLKKRGDRLEVRIGKAVGADRVAEIGDDRELMEYLRMRTYVLGEGESSERSKASFALPFKRPSKPIASPQPAARLAAEVARLPWTTLMVQTDQYQVFCARSWQMPSVMAEIARLREIAFREVGEGTGRALDRDRFDDYYLQLFVWNPSKREIVGAYRLGLTDEILARFGVKGLYTRTLYRYSQDFIADLGPAVELGRSFVSPAYQREFAPLHLLWKGIGSYLAANPRYRYLFGPVSVSGEYHSASVQLLAQYLREHNLAEGLYQQVHPTHPYRSSGAVHWDDSVTCRLLGNIDEISTLITQIESGQRGVPILLKHYLRLGGRVLGLNIDPHFSNVLDALVLVDMLKTDSRILARYFGREKARGYLAWHSEVRLSPPRSDRESAMPAA